MSSIAPPRPPVSPPAEAELCLASSLVAISKSIRVLLGLKLADLGINNGQDDMLLALHLQDTLPGSLLAAAINVRPSTISKMADRLVARGLVERISIERDARQTLLRLTPAGYRVREEIETVRSRLSAEIDAQARAAGFELSASDMEALAMLLRRQIHRLR